MNRVVKQVHAVNGVSFSIDEGEIVGIVGESGCGKSTLGKMIVRLTSPTSGSVHYRGQNITSLSARQLRPYRKNVQIIFQDPYSSLNPRFTVRETLVEAVRLHRIVSSDTIESYLDQIIAKVGLRPEAKDNFPHEFSGGQRQRIGIARALALQPELLVADEPVSALDVSIQAQVLNLMMDLKEEFGLTILLISHDLKVIEHFCDRILVMYLGTIVESLPSEDLFTRARHPYTRALMEANPVNDPADTRRPSVLKGEVPSPYDLPTGCPFTSRCPIVEPRCRESMPPLIGEASQIHQVACWAVNEPHAAKVSNPI